MAPSLQQSSLPPPPPPPPPVAPPEPAAGRGLGWIGSASASEFRFAGAGGGGVVVAVVVGVDEDGAAAATVTVIRPEGGERDSLSGDACDWISSSSSMDGSIGEADRIDGGEREREREIRVFWERERVGRREKRDGFQFAV